MDGTLFNEPFQQWANDVLVWIGFGTLVGLLAKTIMPGRDPAAPWPPWPWVSAAR